MKGGAFLCTGTGLYIYIARPAAVVVVVEKLITSKRAIIVVSSRCVLNEKCFAHFVFMD